MRNSILTITKKELARFFGDKRMVISILLPGIFIYIAYSFMGTAMGSSFGVDENYVPSIQAVGLPDSADRLLAAAELPVLEAGTEEEARAAVTGIWVRS